MFAYFETQSDIIAAFPTEDACLNYLTALRWGFVVVSPFDPLSIVYTCKNQNYRCKNTGKYFNVKTGTIFHNTKISLQLWFVAIWLVTQYNPVVTSVELGTQLNITQKTAWYMMRRIRKHFVKEIVPISKNKLPVSRKIANIEIIAEAEKLKLGDWLQFIKR